MPERRLASRTGEDVAQRRIAMAEGGWPRRTCGRFDRCDLAGQGVSERDHLGRDISPTPKLWPRLVEELRHKLDPGPARRNHGQRVSARPAQRS
jgi:hypothetical protein